MPRRHDLNAETARAENARRVIAEDLDERAALRARINKMIRAKILAGELAEGHPGYADLAHEDRQAGRVRPHPRPGLDLFRHPGGD